MGLHNEGVWWSAGETNWVRQLLIESEDRWLWVKADSESECSDKRGSDFVQSRIALVLKPGSHGALQCEEIEGAQRFVGFNIFQEAVPLMFKQIRGISTNSRAVKGPNQPATHPYPRTL